MTMKILKREKIDCEHLLGQFLDETHYDTLIDFDCAVYRFDPLVAPTLQYGEENVIAIFKKNHFTKEEQEGAYLGLKDCAKPTQNRGLAAGPKGKKLQGRDWVTVEQLAILNYLAKIGDLPTREEIETVSARARTMMDTRGLVWLATAKEEHEFTWDRFIHCIFNLKAVKNVNSHAQWVLDNMISDTTYANPVDSGIAGWFDRYPRIPYGRPTAYTHHNYDKFKLSYPFLKELSTAFRDYLPDRFAAQEAVINKLDPAFYVPGTVFTTITVNKNFRTAAHRDAGDFNDGFSNLTVVAKDNDYEGGYLIIPEIRAAFNVRPGDLLLINNHEYIHGNTPITGKSGFERISLVCYFRENMLELGSKAYEDLRYQYVESRRLNKDHPLWREGWNGVSEQMWEKDEWYDFLRKNGHEDFVQQYHTKEAESTLDALFG